MSSPWIKRKARLGALLQSNGDEDAEGVALDRILHGQSVIGKTSKTTEIDVTRFTDKDLSIVGTLEYGQFGVIDVVTCSLDGRVYVRKSIEKRFAFKTRDQCNPQIERDILLQALRGNTVWAPHLLCAFQTPTHLNIVMEYAEGGSLWDVLESSPLDGCVVEADLHWWFPQIVSALVWCHSQGFVHRDVKPHNFVLNQVSHIQLIDFGSAAPLLPPRPDGARLVPRRHCLVPCGTCDYISPEVLQAHEEALVALEMSEDEGEARKSRTIDGDGGYGVETDWWSMGAMLYEMAYGVAPFFASDIRHTYMKIMDHKRSLKFKCDPPISESLEDLMRLLLTDRETRLGRTGAAEIMNHPFFDGVEWEDLHIQNHPDGLHLPQFSYVNTQSADSAAPLGSSESQTFSSNSSHSQGFAFSAFFQSSERSGSDLHPTPRPKGSILREQASDYFIGFSWGPTLDAFQASSSPSLFPSATLSVFSSHDPQSTPRPNRALTLARTPFRVISTPFRTPYNYHSVGTSTLPRASTLLRRTAPRRTMSDREAMRQLVDCIGLSARKKVLAAGRTPRGMQRMNLGGFGSVGIGKALRFVPSPIEIQPEMGVIASKFVYEAHASDGGEQSDEREY
ncbi:hypothetical protein EW146_g4295 [Bondarzewia mesenterica]|uniref:Protein kinase domain-containing protein n=1 Tax=Bondarzewia mesenterica TaxID=1095465 RepID=A0A4V3XF61_9AGAM|nr:hypothetical protein EW146_g4295 [Bondarzewia mesenterica]